MANTPKQGRQSHAWRLAAIGAMSCGHVVVRFGYKGPQGSAMPTTRSWVVRNGWA